jgi:hypothetical protein
MQVLNENQLKDLIETAWANADYPGDDRLMDYTGNCVDLVECQEILNAFRNKSWRELSVEFIRYHCDDLGFMTLDGYRYYLPAYLLAAALHYYEADVVSDIIVHSLIPPYIDGLTLEQKRAVRAFLEFMKAHYADHYRAGDLDKALGYLDKALSSAVH